MTGVQTCALPISEEGDFGGDGNDELAGNIIDQNLGDKYFNKAQDDGHGPGVNTGFVIVPKAGSSTITGVQFATANDMPDRDPVRITIEGSNDANAARAQGNGFALIYEGLAGLESDPGRNHWGQVVGFKNTASYKVYRILVTATRGDAADATQYSEVRLGTTIPPVK